MIGKVYLIGAGCGEADLITLKGLKKLVEADIVLFDSLVDETLLNNLSDNVEKIYVGKRYNQKSMPQNEINNLLIENAMKGKTVVRLKGGDPYVFGRGSEEALVLEEKNIPYEVIPGISSAIAVPELAGIPLTHRKLSRSFTVLTGSALRADDNENITPIDYEILTKLGGTIVFLMGYHHLSEIIEGFLEAGMNRNMPCSIISKGCTKEQKIIKGNINDIVLKAQEANLQTPIIIVIGECVNLGLNGMASEKIENEPRSAALNFSDLRIAVTGTEIFVKKMDVKLSAKQAKTLDFGFLDVVANEQKLPDFSSFSWVVFTSQNGIEQFFIKLKNEHKDIRLLSNLKFAVIGSGTADKLLEYGIYSDFIPSCYDSHTLAKEILKVLNPNDKILICRAENGSEDLVNTLQKHNYEYTDYKIYSLKENEFKKTFISALKKEYFDVNYLVFGSAKGVTTFFDNFKDSLSENVKMVCIGEVCAQALKNYNISDFLIADKYNVDGIIECIEKDFNKG